MYNTLLEVKNISVEYYRRKKTIPAVRNVSLKLSQAETIGIVGESGCGKSTLALSILKLIQPYEGKITSGEILFTKQVKPLPYMEDKTTTNKVKYENLLSLSDEQLQQIRGKEISIIFQDPFSALNPLITVGEQIAETIKAHSHNIIQQEIKEKVINVFFQVQLPDPERIYKSYPHQLSGGQRQRVCIATAIVTEPKLLIADEPTTALDVTVQKEILDLLYNIQQNRHLGMIFISHNLWLVANQTQRILVMYAGEILEEGPTEYIISKPLHPYTRLLLDSLPTLDKRGTKLPYIKGTVPDLCNLPNGCKFHPRCDRVTEICTKAIPQFVSVDKEHSVKCHLYGKN